MHMRKRVSGNPKNFIIPSEDGAPRA